MQSERMAVTMGSNLPLATARLKVGFEPFMTSILTINVSYVRHELPFVANKENALVVSMPLVMVDTNYKNVLNEEI